MMKKIFGVFLTIIMTIGLFLGCGGGVQEEINPYKTQLYVNYFDSGLGERWLQSYKQAFEAFYADTVFEDGKTGVQVMIDSNAASGNDAAANLQYTNAEIIWSENLMYHDLVSRGLAIDISDIMTDPLIEYEENRSIKEKLDDNMQKYLESYNGKYYALPYYDGYKGIIYDIDLFEDKGFYVSSALGAPEITFTTGAAGAPAKSKGPDNTENTYDDGLPATYSEFFAMMDEMLANGVTPFVWTGKSTYADMLTRALWSTFEGKEQISINYNMRGTATSLVTVTAENNVNHSDHATYFESADLLPIGDTVIGSENGYQVFRQEGRYRSLQFARRLMSNNAYYLTGSTKTHTQAQDDFLYGKALSNKPTVAMLIDGAWWEEEASGAFNSMVADYVNGEQYSKENRNFGYMPMPYYNETQVISKHNSAEKQTVMSTNYSYVFISSIIKPEKLALAKKFLQFTSSDAMLADFTETISVSRPFNYEISGDRLSMLSSYAQSIYNVRRNSDVVYPFSGDPFWISSELDYTAMSFGHNSLATPIYAFKEDASLTAKNYFDTIYDYQAGRWASYKRPL